LILDRLPNNFFELLGGRGFLARDFLWRALNRRDRLHGTLVLFWSPTPEGSPMNLAASRTLITFTHN
jgi:hypothetical protein